MPASDHMLRGRLPWGLGRGVYLFDRSFARSLIVRGRGCFRLRVGGRYGILLVFMKITGGLEWDVVVVYCEGVPSVVVLEVSPPHVKTFHCPRRPNNHQLPPAPCAMSLHWLYWIQRLAGSQARSPRTGAGSNFDRPILQLREGNIVVEIY